MPGKQFSILILVIAVWMAGCAVNINQPVLPAAATALVAAGPDLQTTQVPVTWSGLKLGGRLIYLAGTQQDGNPLVTLESLDLANGVITPIFRTPPQEWIYAACISPDNKQIVLSYATAANFPAIYNMPSNGASMQLLFRPPTRDDQYTQPVWSPDGKFIYIVHVNFMFQTGKQNLPVYEIERVAYPGGAPERLLTNAYWPRLSPDGSRLAYVSQDPNNGTNRLFLANADGSNPQQVKLSGPDVPSIIDAPLFLPGGRTVLFSAPAPALSFTPGWLDWLLGVQVASAHNVISEWWSVPAAGGIPTQLTHIQAPGLYASISPDGQWLASFSANGIFVMHPDGSGLIEIVSAVGGVAGTVDWIP